MKRRYYIDTCIYLNLWQKEIDPKTGLKFWKIARDFLQKIENTDSIVLLSGFVLKEISYILGNSFNDRRGIFSDHTKFERIFASPQDYDYARILEKEFNYEISFFDCIHIAICKRLNFTLITRDEKMIMFGSKYCEIYKPEKFL